MTTLKSNDFGVDDNNSSRVLADNCQRGELTTIVKYLGSQQLFQSSPMMESEQERDISGLINQCYGFYLKMLDNNESSKKNLKP